MGVILLTNLFSAFIEFEPIEITQPDGTVLSCFATGDEFFNWAHDENNYTIIRDEMSGYYTYATLENEELVSSSYIYGSADPVAAGLEPGLVRIPANIAEKRRAWEESIKKPDGTRVSTTGVINNLVVFIRFSDQSEFTESISSYDSMFNDEDVNSMYQYYQEVSSGQLSINSGFYPEATGTTVVSYQDSHPRTYYQVYNQYNAPDGYSGDNERTQREHALLRDAAEFVASQIPEDLDIDNDDDGYVDNICYIIKGSSEGWAELLWPHMWSLYSYDAYIHGAQVGTFNFQLSNSLANSGVGVLCHEMFHSLGAPDLYHYSYDGISPAGSWDLMCSNQNPPQHMTAYMKYKYGHWFDEIPELTSGGIVTLDPLSQSPYACYKIASPNSNQEYFMVEYRKAEGIFESSIPGSGMLVYRINPNYNGNADGPPDELYIYRPGGTTSNDGSVGMAHFSQETGRTEISDNTNPSAFLGNGADGGLFISEIGSAGDTIEFNLQMGLIAEFTTDVISGPAWLGVSFTNESAPLDQITSYEWDFDGDGLTDSYDENPFHFYLEEGDYDVTLRISDGIETVEITKPAYIHVTDSSNISGNVAGYWPSTGSPYFVVDDITVPAGEELTLDPGTLIYMENNSSFILEGKLQAAGTETQPINFDTNSIWKGIKFVNSEIQSQISYTHINSVVGNSLTIDGSNVMVDNCWFINGVSAIGGAVSVKNSSMASISQSLFMNNIATSSGGALNCESSALTLKNNLVVNNTGSSAGAFLFLNSNPDMEHNTISGNIATNVNNGASIMLYNSNPVIKNSIIWDEQNAFFVINSSPTVSHSNVQGGYEGTGNLNVDPLFESPAAINGAGNGQFADLWYLQSNSPCIDAGLDSSMYYDVTENGEVIWPAMGTQLPDMGAFGSIGFPTDYTVDADDDEYVPLLTTSMKIYPNPFNPTTNIMLNLSDKDNDSPVSLKVFNLKGQLVKTVLSNEVTSERSYSWNGKDNNGSATASGIYFVQLKTASEVSTSKILLMK